MIVLGFTLISIAVRARQQWQAQRRREARKFLGFLEGPVVYCYFRYVQDGRLECLEKDMIAGGRRTVAETEPGARWKWPTLEDQYDFHKTLDDFYTPEEAKEAKPRIMQARRRSLPDVRHG